MTKRDVPGFAIGGLSGGESKDQFWRMVALSTSRLPKDKPRYLMGVGYVQKQGNSCTRGIADFWRPSNPSCPHVCYGKGHSPAWEGTKDMALCWGLLSRSQSRRSLRVRNGVWLNDQGLRDSPLPSAPHGPTPSYATDLVVCVALGCDMFDCVFPTRTAVRPWAVGSRDGPVDGPWLGRGQKRRRPGG